MDFSIFIRAFEKVKRVLDCHISKSNLFHSDIVDRKTKYLKIPVLLYNIATSSTDRDLYIRMLFGIRSYKYEGKQVLLILSKVQSFLNQMVRVIQ